jgi:hypothetical protein
MACTLGNSSPNSCIGSWESKYHFFELSDKHILSSLPLNTSIPKDMSNTWFDYSIDL